MLMPSNEMLVGPISARNGVKLWERSLWNVDAVSVATWNKSYGEVVTWHWPAKVSLCIANYGVDGGVLAAGSWLLGAQSATWPVNQFSWPVNQLADSSG